MKRGGPLRRRAPLQSGKPLERKSPLRSSGKPLANRSARRVQRGDALDVSPRDRAAVMTRAAHWCEARLDVCEGTVGLAPHHRLRRAHGDHRPVNLVVLCRACHRWVHGHPEWARTVGLIVPGWAGPPESPWVRPPDWPSG